MATVEATQRKKVGVQNNLIIGLNHISIFVRNVDEATKFWMDIFEAEPYRDFPPKQLFHVKLSGVVLAFLDSRRKIGRSHIRIPALRLHCIPRRHAGNEKATRRRWRQDPSVVDAQPRRGLAVFSRSLGQPVRTLLPPSTIGSPSCKSDSARSVAIFSRQ